MLDPAAKHRIKQLPLKLLKLPGDPRMFYASEGKARTQVTVLGRKRRAGLQGEDEDKRDS